MGKLPTLRLVIYALRLAFQAQAIRRTHLEQVIAQMATTVKRPVLDDSATLVSTALRISLMLARSTGTLDNCLTKRLIVGPLLARQQPVLLHIGFMPDSPGRAYGHDWLTEHGNHILPGDASDTLGAYECCLAIHLKRPSKDG